MAELTKAQRMMVEDGFPAELFRSAEERRAWWRDAPRPRYTHTFADKKPAKDEDPATAQLRKEAVANERKQKAERLARLRSLKKETAKKAQQPAAKAATEESDVTTRTVKKAKATANAKSNARQPAGKKGASKPARAAHSAVSREQGIRPGSKLEAIVGLLARPQGCTTADVLKATGWPSVSMPQQAKAAGLTLRKEKRDGITVYYGKAA